MNPLINYLYANNLGLTPAWLPHPSQVTPHTAEIDSNSPAVPGSVNYLPPLKPSHIPMDDWLPRVSALMSESTYGFIADIWTAILSRKDPTITPDIYLLWNEQIPKPTRLTALFWLLTCEVWPLVESLPRISRLQRTTDNGEDNCRGHVHADSNTKLTMAQLFPPQPFMMPMSQHYNIAGSMPSDYVRTSFRTPNHRPLSTLLSQSMTRSDRERMSQMASDHVPIYSLKPNESVALEDHWLTPESVRLYHRKHESGFLPQRDMLHVGGYGYAPVFESQHQLHAIHAMRMTMMSGLNFDIGMSTHLSNVYGVPGGHIRCLSEDMLAVSGRQFKPWGTEGERIIFNGRTIASQFIPSIMPRVWFGWTGTQRWLPQIEEFNPHFEWVKEYLTHRPFAIECMFHPERVYLEAEWDAQTAIRSETLAKAKRISNGKPVTEKKIESKAAFSGAFAALSGSFKFPG